MLSIEVILPRLTEGTIADPAEATGIVQAAKSFGLPVVVAFTVEIDGRLPTGASLEKAIKQPNGSFEPILWKNNVLHAQKVVI